MVMKEPIGCTELTGYFYFKWLEEDK